MCEFVDLYTNNDISRFQTSTRAVIRHIYRSLHGQ